MNNRILTRPAIFCDSQSQELVAWWVNTFTWQNGRQLAGMSKPGVNASFVYNKDGLRVQKTVNGVVTNYTLHGKNVVHMTRGNDDLHFFYDAQNKPAVVVYNGVSYAYVKNLQGDIIAILDSAYTPVVQYTYDAWGRILATAGSMASTLGTVQPFRYRGYVYDEETELYYLRSRYYKPSWCRFVNADVILGAGRLISHNLFAYCCNLPSIYVDTEGYAFVCCFDENGIAASFMAMCMGGGGGSGSYVSGIVIPIVQDMTAEDWINEAKTILVIGVSMVASKYIMGASHLLGKGFFAEAMMENAGPYVGSALYAFTVANGLGITYIVDKSVHDIVGKQYEIKSHDEILKDFVHEFIPMDVPSIVEFLKNYMEESIDLESISFENR